MFFNAAELMRVSYYDDKPVKFDLILVPLQTVEVIPLSQRIPVIKNVALLAPQSGALRISAYRDFHPIPSQSTYSFQAFKPFYSDQKQCK